MGDDDDSGDDSPRRRRASSSDSIPLPASSGRITTELVGPLLRLPEDVHEGVPLPDDDFRLDGEPAPASLPSRSDIASIPPAPPQSGALGLVERSRLSSSGLDLVAEMRERFELDDFTGALRAAELILGRRPHDPEAGRVCTECRAQLERFYIARLGSLESRAQVAVKASEIRWLGLDHRAGFLLSRIDGSHTIEELLSVSGMPRLETLKTLVDLKLAEAVTFD